MTFTNGIRGFQFVDTNILVYLHDFSAGKKQTLAWELATHLWDTGEGCVSLQVLQEFYVTVTRKWIHPLPIPLAIQVIQDLAQWRVHRPTVNDLVAAANLQQQYQISYWDALIINSAKQLNCTVIWSEDLNTGQHYQGIPVRSPFQ
jgi:predicted nucleic acid-binding protein